MHFDESVIHKMVKYIYKYNIEINDQNIKNNTDYLPLLLDKRNEYIEAPNRPLQ